MEHTTIIHFAEISLDNGRLTVARAEATYIDIDYVYQTTVANRNHTNLQRTTGRREQGYDTQKIHQSFPFYYFYMLILLL